MAKYCPVAQLFACFAHKAHQKGRPKSQGTPVVYSYPCKITFKTNPTEETSTSQAEAKFSGEKKGVSQSGPLMCHILKSHSPATAQAVKSGVHFDGR